MYAHKHNNIVPKEYRKKKERKEKEMCLLIDAATQYDKNTVEQKKNVSFDLRNKSYSEFVRNVLFLSLLDCITEMQSTLHNFFKVTEKSANVLRIKKASYSLLKK